LKLERFGIPVVTEIEEGNGYRHNGVDRSQSWPRLSPDRLDRENKAKHTEKKPAEGGGENDARMKNDREYSQSWSRDRPFIDISYNRSLSSVPMLLRGRPV
jgi:hypothetical protein